MDNIIDISFNFTSNLEIIGFAKTFIKGQEKQVLFESLALYLKNFRNNKEEFTLKNLIKLLDCAIVDENNSCACSAIDIMFEEAEKDNPVDLAIQKYKSIKMLPYSKLKEVVFQLKEELTIYLLYIQSNSFIFLPKTDKTSQEKQKIDTYIMMEELEIED